MKCEWQVHRKIPRDSYQKKSEFLARKRVEKKIVLMENKNDMCNNRKK